MALLALISIAFVSTVGVFGGPVNNLKVQPFSPGFGDSRIMNGQRAERGQFPHQGALAYDDFFACGCSLIGEHYALTAGHCTHDKTEPQRLSVLLGTISLRWSDRPKETDNLIVKVAEVYPHPFYDHGKLLNDVSVIELATPVTFNDFIKPIRLADNTIGSEVGTKLITSGWGRDTDRWIEYRWLRYVGITVLNLSRCQDAYHNNQTMNERVICGFGRYNSGICAGDSGGSLILEAEDGPIQVGITSLGPALCDSYNPSGFTRVSSHIDFIRSVTDRNATVY